MGAGAVAEIITGLEKQTQNPNVLVGINTFDDGGVVKVKDDLALIQTVDFFSPVVDDPFDFGRIAAANSLSDIYAMGGTPVCALNILGVPSDLNHEIAREILNGAQAATEEAGCTIVGGHSFKNKDIFYGLSVTGQVHPDRIIKNSTAKAGDKIVLTKPLGIGVLTTALRAEKLDHNDIIKITGCMARLNKYSAEAMIETGVSAATDITGFGLLGHLIEVCQASNLSAGISISKVPYFKEALEMIENCFSGGSSDNYNLALPNIHKNSGISDGMIRILADAQTSGGLLISVPDSVATELLQNIKNKGDAGAAIIGEFKPKEEKYITVIE
ncbi:MAG: selenide, water dikinase SelD [bacterium]